MPTSRVRELVEVCDRLGILLEVGGGKLWYWPGERCRAEHPELLVELKRYKVGLIEYMERGEL